MQALDPTKDTAAIQRLKSRIKAEEWKAEKSARASCDGAARLSALAHNTHRTHNIDRFQTFEERVDPEEGFGAINVLSQQGKTGGNKEVQAAEGSFVRRVQARHTFTEKEWNNIMDLLRYRGRLDPVADARERLRISNRVKFLRRIRKSEASNTPIGADPLEDWRTSGERDRYSQILVEMRGLCDDATAPRRSQLEAGLKYLNGVALKRQASEARKINFVEAARRELNAQMNPEDLIALPNGRVMTQREQEMREKSASRLRELEILNQEEDKVEKQRLSEQIQKLDSQAWARGVVLRQQAGARRGKASSVSERLALLKKTLTGSPEDVTSAPAVEEQLPELEHTFRTSLMAGMAAKRPAAGGNREFIGLSRATLSGNSSSTSTPDSSQRSLMPDEHNLEEEGPPTALFEAVNSVAHNSCTKGRHSHFKDRPFAEESPEEGKDCTQDNQRSIPCSEDLALFVDLKAQIQELTNVLKLLVPQQLALQGDQPAAAATSTAATAISQVLEKANALVEASISSKAESIANKDESRLQRSKHLGQERTERAIKGLPPNSREADLDSFSSLPHEVGFQNELQSVPNNSDHVLSTSPNNTAEPPSEDAPSVRSKADTMASLDELGSLYEQLFPEEASQASQAHGNGDAIPRLLLPRGAEPTLTQVTGNLTSKSEQLARLYDEQRERQKSVLTLRNASKTLSEDDFRRAMPRGKHLQEWTAKGEFEKIIPVRDFWTLERTGDYYIVFKNDKAADVFLKHVKRVFEMTKQHIPSSLLSPLPPAPKGLLSDGAENEAEVVRNFSLLAPTMYLSLERERSGIKSEVLKRGGYPQALSGGLTAETPQVLLEMDGGNMPNWFQLRDAIAKDGMRRSLPWNLLPGALGIRKLEMQRPSQSQRDLEAEWEASLGNGVNELADGTYERDGNTVKLDAQDRLRNGQNGQRWIIAFKEREEAQRFARIWHMRSFPWTEEENRKDRVYKGMTRMKAEMLW
jgi:hypothetical protein